MSNVRETGDAVCTGYPSAASYGGTAPGDTNDIEWADSTTYNPTAFTLTNSNDLSVATLGDQVWTEDDAEARIMP